MHKHDGLHNEMGLTRKGQFNMTSTIIDDVADAITRLRFLEQKSRDDDAMLRLLTQQKDALTQELADTEHNHSVELFKAESERDAAVKRANDVRDIMTKIGETAAQGIRRSRESDTDEVQHPDTKMGLVEPEVPWRTGTQRVVPSSQLKQPLYDPVTAQGDKLAPPSLMRRPSLTDEARASVRGQHD